MDQPLKVAKPARGQLNREIKCPCGCIRGKYIVYVCTVVCICLCVRYIFYLKTYICVRSTAVYAYICDYSERYLCMCICIVVTYNKGEDQTWKVANPARGQLAEQGKWIVPCTRSRLSIWSRKTGSAVPSHVSVFYLN